MPRIPVSQQQSTAKTNQQIYDSGCEWCGGKIPSIDESNAGGFVTYGLEYAHIFASRYAPSTIWNGFLLCPTCHKIFDHVVKPRLHNAIVTALTGFTYQPKPSVPAASHVVAHSYAELLERLIADNRSPGWLPEPNTALPKVAR